MSLRNYGVRDHLSVEEARITVCNFRRWGRLLRGAPTSGVGDEEMEECARLCRDVAGSTYRCMPDSWLATPTTASNWLKKPAPAPANVSSKNATVAMPSRARSIPEVLACGMRRFEFDNMMSA